MRLPRLALLAVLPGALTGCWVDSHYPTYSLGGDAIPFNGGPDGRIEGATITVLERPEMSVITGADGHFQFDGLVPGEEVTLVLEHPDYHVIQTGTQTMDFGSVHRVTFQAVTNEIYALLAQVVGVMPDEASCQMVTTITRIGKSLYDEGAHGEAGVTVSVDPPLSAEHGPIYFNSSVIPDKSLVESSDDGGVLYIQVPPGVYDWTAEKPGATFAPVKMKCRPGVLVNASPPHGLQRLQ